MLDRIRPSRILRGARATISSRATNRSSRWASRMPRPSKLQIQPRRQRPWRTGKSGGTYSSVVNNSLPSLTTARLSLFPNSIRIRSDALDIGGQSLTQLADQFGTPLYIYDLATLDANVEAYRAALSRHYPGSAEITYAGKAFLCNAIAQWAHLHELWVDCTGAGEIGIAVAAGVPRENILVHGVNKSAADLASALKHAATIVVDNLTKLGRIGDLVARSNRGAPDLWLRLQPGLAVQTHHSHTQTAQSDTKFGMTAEELKQAPATCKEQHLTL